MVLFTLNLKSQNNSVHCCSNVSKSLWRPPKHYDYIAVNSPILCTIIGGVRETTVMCRNNFDWDCSSSAHSFQIDDRSLSGHSSLCGFTFSRTDDASSIENLMLFDKVESEVWDVERDVQVTSALLKVEKKKRLKDSTLSLSVVKPDCFMWHLLE